MGILVYRDRDGERDLLGRIDYRSGRSASFQYDARYLERARALGELGISERLPLDSAAYGAEEFGAFFRGLLPEGGVYEGLIEMYQVARNDYLALLEQLGCESIGALTLLSENVDPSEYEPRYEALSRADIDEMLKDPMRAAVGASSSTRLSLAGAQSKVAWYLAGGWDPRAADLSDWLVPRGTAPSSHIVKLSRRGEERLALNEHACSLLAASCGIDVARTALLPALPGAIAVERYDREQARSDGATPLVRLHQEDFCQAIGFPPYLKYQPDSGEGDYLRYCSDLIDSACANPRADRIEYAKRLAFNYAVGNTDAHLKNSALLYDRTWTSRSLAPLYDVTCIPLTGYSTRMPFTVGEHRQLDEIAEGDIMTVAMDLDVDLSEFDVGVRQVVAGFESPRLPEWGGEVGGMVDEVIDNAAPRLAVLRRYLG